MRTIVRSVRPVSALLAGLLLALPAAAQDAAPLDRLRPGLVIGASIARMTAAGEAVPRDGGLAGATLTWFRDRRLAFQAEVLYAQKGVEGTLRTRESSAPMYVTLRNDYIEVPVLARWRVPLGTNFTPFVIGGPSVAFSIDCEADDESAPAPRLVNCDRFASHNNFDAGAVLGAGIEIPTGHDVVSLSARLDFGFREVFDASRARNRTANLMLGYWF